MLNGFAEEVDGTHSFNETIAQHGDNDDPNRSSPESRRVHFFGVVSDGIGGITAKD